MDELDPGAEAPVVSEDVNQPEPEVTATPETPPQEQERKFTQAELNEAVQKRLLKEERRVHRRVEAQLREQFERQQAQVAPRRESYATDEAFTLAQRDQEIERKAEEKLQAREREREAARQLDSFEERAEKAAERYPDFESVARNPTLRISDPMAEFIRLSEQGPDIAYHLGKNPSLADRLASMSPIGAAVELSRLEREIASRPQAKASNAPEPITPVGTRGRASSSALPSDDDDYATWAKKEIARMNARYK
jgi:hypothetical protein